jgi:hypothetical protein
VTDYSNKSKKSSPAENKKGDTKAAKADKATKSAGKTT